MALHCKRHGRSIVLNRSAPEATVTGKTNSRKPKDASAGASCRAIGDNGSTLGMVDRLSPIDRNLKPPQPVSQTAENRKTPPLARRVERLGTMALHCKRHGRSIVPNRSELEATATGKTDCRKPKAAAAGASCRAIGDNRSTLGMVDRLSSIDRSLKPP